MGSGKIKYSVKEEDLGWNNPNKTQKQKDLMSFRANLLNSRIKYPLNLKIKFAERRIQAAITKYGLEQCFIGFSGGKDSTVLSHIATSMGYKVDHVYSNTGLEYPECISFAIDWCKQYDLNLIFITPDIRPIEVWKKYGYPVFSKDVAETLERLRTGKQVAKKIKQRAQKYLKYQNVPISAKCCKYLKTEPMKKYRIESGKKLSILGTRSGESRRRRMVWIRKGCLYETRDNGNICNPLAFFTEEDIWAYAKKHNIKFAEIYQRGIERNGCYCCGFGCNARKDFNVYSILKRDYPALWNTVMDKWGFREILNACDVDIQEKITLKKWSEKNTAHCKQSRE